MADLRGRDCGARRRALALVVAGVCGSAGAIDPLALGTAGDGSLAVVLVDPVSGLPQPIQATVTLPSGAGPHGADFLTADEVLLADFFAPRLFRIRASTAQLLDTIPLAGRTSANGTLAVSVDGSVAISAGETTINGPSEAVVVRPPWGSGAQVTPLALPGRVRSFNTQAVAFARSGRAFVCHSAGISALDPPYSAVSFTLALASTSGTNCALSRDDQRLYAVRPGVRRIEVFAAPFIATSVSTPIAYPVDAGDSLSPILVSPDREQLLIGQVFRRTGQMLPDARVWVVEGLNATPNFAELSLPLEITGNICQGSTTLCPGFEDASLSADGQLAVFTGQSVFSASSAGRAPALLIRSPFDAAARASFAITIGSVASGTHGRGAGAARFAPAYVPLFKDGFEN